MVGLAGMVLRIGHCRYTRSRRLYLFFMLSKRFQLMHPGRLSNMPKAVDVAYTLFHVVVQSLHCKLMTLVMSPCNGCRLVFLSVSPAWTFACMDLTMAFWQANSKDLVHDKCMAGVFDNLLMSTWKL